VVIACPPRLTRHARRFLQAEHVLRWRAEWATNATTQAFAGLGANGQVIETRVPSTSLQQLTRQLHRTHGPLRVVDARRPKFGLDLPALTAGQTLQRWRLELPSAIAGLGAALILAAE
jgi:hypothetical protein